MTSLAGVILGAVFLLTGAAGVPGATGAPRAPGAGAPSATLEPVAGPAVLDEIVDLVERRFCCAARIDAATWRSQVPAARDTLAKTQDPTVRVAVIRDLLHGLGTSHTELYSRDDPGYWAITSIFEPNLGRLCAQERLPPLPIERADIGVHWKGFGDEWFVGGLLAGGPAAKIGLKVGDHVLTADGKPFGPVRSFVGKAGKKVRLGVRRLRGGEELSFTVQPAITSPMRELLQAAAGSFTVHERLGKRIAYLHVWSWTSLDVQQVVLESIARANAEHVDGFILDIRDGWGGASTHYLGMYWQDLPVLEGIDREGKTMAFDYRMPRNSVLLINGGTRSGKETIAFGAKVHHLAKLVGERTAGAVVFGQPFCLKDGSLLLLAVTDARVDGERLEGRGVTPDVEVPFDLRYAAGADPQLERALDIVAVGAGG